MRRFLSLIAFLATLQVACGQQAGPESGPAAVAPSAANMAEAGPRLIPALPESQVNHAILTDGSSATPMIRPRQLPRVRPTTAVQTAAAAQGAGAVKRADHVEPARLPKACRCETVEQELTVTLPGGLGFGLAEPATGESGACCCGVDWAQWCLERVAAYLSGDNSAAQLAAAGGQDCNCSDDCRCGSKCKCSSESRCQNACRCGANPADRVESVTLGQSAGQSYGNAAGIPGSKLYDPPEGRLCHVETIGGNYFGRLRSIDSQWIVLVDEPNDTSHWIPHKSLRCLSVMPESVEQVDEPADERANDDRSAATAPPCDRSARCQVAAYDEAPAEEPLPHPQPLPLNGKVVFSGGAGSTYAGEGGSVRGVTGHSTVEVPRGKRLHTLSFPWHRVMQLEPGDRLDLLAVVSVQTAAGYPQVVSRTFAHNVQVADIEAGEADDGMLSLLLTPEQCELVTVAAFTGDIVFSKRNPADDEDVSERSSAATLRKLLGPALEELDAGGRLPVVSLGPYGPAGHPPLGMSAVEPYAMPGPGTWPHPGFANGPMGPPHLNGGCPTGPECGGPGGMPPYAAVPYAMFPQGPGMMPQGPEMFPPRPGMLPQGPGDIPPSPFGPPPAMPTFAPNRGADGPEHAPHEQVAPPYLEAERPLHPKRPKSKTVPTPAPTSGGKAKAGERNPSARDQETAPEFDPFAPGTYQPLKTSEALPAGRVLTPVGFSASAAPLRRASATVPGGSVRQAVTLPASTPEVYRLQCSYDMQRDGKQEQLGRSTAVTIDETVVTFGDLEFRFHVNPAGPKHVQLTFNDPRGQLQVLRVREGEEITLPWRSESSENRGDVRVRVVRVPQPLGKVATVSYEEPAEGANDYEVRVYPAGDLLMPHKPAAPVLARSLYARGLLDAVSGAGDAAPRPSDEAHAALLSAIRAVQPDSWHPRGEGSVRYSPATISLVIRQSPENHERIADLFEQLRTEGTSKAGTAERQSSRRQVAQ